MNPREITQLQRAALVIEGKKSVLTVACVSACVTASRGDVLESVVQP